MSARDTILARIRRSLKVDGSELLGKTVFEIYQRKDAERIDASDSEALAGEFGCCVQDYELEMPDGQMRVLATNRLVVRDATGVAKHLVVVIDDITERKKSEQRIAFMAHHDVLTGLPNRLSIMEKIEDAIARHRRRGDSFAVLLLDLDRFKHVNDTLGHAVGDELLRETAVRLKASLRDTDVLARLGGDEFAIVQDRESNQREAASALADRIIEIVSKPFDIEGNEVIASADIEERIATQPSKKFLGMFRGVVYDYSLFDKGVLQRDLERVERYYKARGYYEAKARAARVIYTEDDHVEVT